MEKGENINKQNKSAKHSILNPAPAIKGSNFSNNEIENSRQKNKLLTISLLLSNVCNLNCTYCYRDAGEKERISFTVKDWENIIIQAKELGVKNVWIPGSGEPLLDKAFFNGTSFPLIEFCDAKGLSLTFFTNGTMISKEIASSLIQYDVSIVTKLNSFKPEIQDYLAGKKGAFNDIINGLNTLLEVGFAKQSPTHLGIDTVITSKNIDEIHKIFRFCRDNNVIPYITVNLHGGRASGNRHLDVSQKKIAELFFSLLEIDKTEYGYDWFPSPPIVASQCKKLFYDLVVDFKGDVYVCPGIDIKLGNIKNQSLHNILISSVLLQKIRNMPDSLEGKCKSCAYPNCIYGCRLEAFSQGNLFGPDPMCWY